MARQRKTDSAELMKAAEILLLEKGYKGFHFKALSEGLDVARSTIYEYYSNKDELITDYMIHLMEAIMEKIDQLQQDTDTINKLKKLLALFLEYSYLHSVMSIRPLIEQSSSEMVESNLLKLDLYHKEMFELIILIIEEARLAGFLRKDLPSTVAAGIFFHAITIPNVEGFPADKWSSILFDIILNGLKS